jgi:hypothetical protein
MHTARIDMHELELWLLDCYVCVRVNSDSFMKKMYLNPSSSICRYEIISEIWHWVCRSGHTGCVNLTKGKATKVRGQLYYTWRSTRWALRDNQSMTAFMWWLYHTNQTTNCFYRVLNETTIVSAIYSACCDPLSKFILTVFTQGSIQWQFQYKI